MNVALLVRQFSPNCAKARACFWPSPTPELACKNRSDREVPSQKLRDKVHAILRCFLAVVVSSAFIGDKFGESLGVSRAPPGF